MHQPVEFRDPPPPQSRGGGGCMKVFLIGCGVAVLIGVIGVVAVVMTWRNIVGSGMRAVVNEAIVQLDVEPEQQARLSGLVDELVEDFKNERLSMDDLQLIFDEFQNSPALVASTVMVVDKGYIEPSGLSTEEKAQAQRTLQRLCRGLVEGTVTLSDEDLQELGGPIESFERGQPKMRSKVSDQELREFLGRLEQHVEAGGVPDAPYEVDVGGELERILTRARDRVQQRTGQPQGTGEPR